MTAIMLLPLETSIPTEFIHIPPRTLFAIGGPPSLNADSIYSVTRAMNPTCLTERYNEGWVTVLPADMGSPSVKALPDHSLIVAKA